MDQFYPKNKNEINYASKFKNESADTPKVIRSGAQQSMPRPGYPNQAATGTPFAGADSRAGSVPSDLYALRAEMINRENNNSQLMLLQNEISRLREELNRQNQRNELREELAKLKEELRQRNSGETPAPVLDRRTEIADKSAERELTDLISELKKTTEETYRADFDAEDRGFSDRFDSDRVSSNRFDSDRPFAGREQSSPSLESKTDTAKTDTVSSVSETPVSLSASAETPAPTAATASVSADIPAVSADLSELVSRLESLKEEISQRTSSEVVEKLSTLPQSVSGASDSIIDTNSIMQSTLLDEIMYLKKLLEEDSVSKSDVGSAADRIVEQLKGALEQENLRGREAEKERDQFVTSQFSLLFEMLAYNFETNSELIDSSKESIEDKIKTLGDGLGRNSSAAAELVIKLTQIISVLGVELGNDRDLVSSVRDQIDARFAGTESAIRAQIEKLSDKLAGARSFENARDGVDMLVSMGEDQLCELVGEEKCAKILRLKQDKDKIEAEPGVIPLAYYIKDKALLLGDYDALVADVSALKAIARDGLGSEASAERVEAVLEFPLDKLVDMSALAETFTVDPREMRFDSKKIENRIDGLKVELVNLEANHQTLFDNISESIREIAAAVESGAKAEELERINRRMEETLPEQLAALEERIAQGIKDNVLDKNETKVRLENLSFELSKLTEFSEISSILYDFKREMEDAVEGNFHEFGTEVAGKVGMLSDKVAANLENNAIAVEVAKLAQNIAVSPNFDQTIVLEELAKLQSELGQLREALSPKSVLKGGMDLSYADDAAAFSEDKK